MTIKIKESFSPNIFILRSPCVLLARSLIIIDAIDSAYLVSFIAISPLATKVPRRSIPDTHYRHENRLSRRFVPVCGPSRLNGGIATSGRPSKPTDLRAIGQLSLTR